MCVCVCVFVKTVVQFTPNVQDQKVELMVVEGEWAAPSPQPHVFYHCHGRGGFTHWVILISGVGRLSGCPRGDRHCSGGRPASTRTDSCPPLVGTKHTLTPSFFAVGFLYQSYLCS